MLCYNIFTQERLSGVFMELGASETESLPFYSLYQHPIVEDCFHLSQRFKYYVSVFLFKSQLGLPSSKM